MVKDNIFMKTELLMLDNGSMIYNMAKALKNGQMEGKIFINILIFIVFLKVFINMVKRKVLENLYGQMGQYMKVNLDKIILMDMENIVGLMENTITDIGKIIKSTKFE